ncbi:trimeric intracellular cation channel family protein [Kocuria sp. LUK]|uniref:trimeric intracellular cation channel family protein n=1 Tax=Kocuria sp. LUK TaxID=2897828 RepID=UPI001E54D3C1|nr:trimeric intracellular cation channel family protein [Kocuria sp. LUK]MCD1144476.1 trimeric intracellular cation channel family protein [Kocuria sp. LUK]
MENLDPRVLFDVVDLLGVLANGVLGGAVARQMRMDLVGFVVLAVVSGLGGGMLRDTLLQVGFPVALTNSAYLSTAIAGAVIAFFLQLRGRWTNRVLVVADALALGCWAATGTSKALGAGLGWLPSIMIGVVTAVGGGMIRDIAVGRVPLIFGGNTLYATGAVVGSLQMAVLHEAGRPNWGMAASILTAATLTVLARRRGWRLPGAGEWNVRLPGPREWPRPRLLRRPRRRDRDRDREQGPEPSG